MCTNRSTQYRATTMDQAGNSCRSRHYRMLRTLAFLSMSGQSMSLIIPGQPTCPASLPRQRTSGISYGMQYRHQKRRRRSLDFELHVQFTSNQDWDLYQTKMYSFQFYPSYKLLQPSRPVAHHNSRRSSESSPKRMSTSLYLAQSSDSAGSGFGKDDEEKNSVGRERTGVFS